jgi:hypothetical protein
VRYAQALTAAGRIDRARELLETTLRNADRQGVAYRDLHRDWIVAARRLLGELG